MKKNIILLLYVLSCLINGYGQIPISQNQILETENVKPITNKIFLAKSENHEFREYNIFRELKSSELYEELKTSVDSFKLLSVQYNEVNKLLSNRPELLRLSIPYNNGQLLDILLIKNTIHSSDFSVTTSSGLTMPSSQINGLHYQGIINNNTNTTVAISFFENEIMGIVYTGNGNLVIGKLKNNENYIFYNDLNLKSYNNFSCGTTGNNNVNSNNNNSITLLKTSTINCVNLYWEINYDIFLDKGSVSNTTNFAMGIFNQSKLLYDNDNINTLLSQLIIWDTPSPYSGTSVDDWLISFRNNTGAFNGDLGHLINYGNGGVAIVNGLCNPDWDFKKCYSGIYNTFWNIPTYSWTVEVITHEQGHLMGSEHTHDCVWNGNNTAIDGCGPAVGFPSQFGTCITASIPISGTIMSYCHIIPNPGINFNLGFGPQPLTRITNIINSASCLSSCTNSNDNCGVSATQLSSNTTCTYISSTVNNSTSSGISIPNCNGFTSPTAMDVWFKFDATCTEHIVTVDPDGNITGNNSYLDAVIALYNTCSSGGFIDCFDYSGGGGYTTSYQFSGLTPGNEYFIRIYDYGSSQPSNGDFEICVTHSCVSNEDIFITNEQVDVSSALPGGIINVDCNQNYSGSSTTTLYPYVGYFLSTDCNYNQGIDVFLGDDQSSIDAIDTDDPESASLTIPSGTSPGNYYVLFVADWTDIVSEGPNENNNTVCVPLQITGTINDDIFITNEQVDVSSALPGGIINVDCNQNYSGSSTTTLYPYVGYFLSTDCNYNQGIDVFLGDDQSSIDAIDTDDPESASLTIPSGTSPGNYYVLFVADWTDIVSEGPNENNNTICVPLQITGTSGGNPVTQSISAGGQHSLAVCSDNTARTWGSNLWGELGNSTNNDSYFPIQVNGITNVIAISGGRNHSIALRADGTVWTWGRNDSGQLGNNTNTDSNSPVQVNNLSNVIAIAGGSKHCLALQSNGTVWAWGSNSNGQLGNGTTLNSNFAIQIDSLSGIVAIATGLDHNLALSSNGTVWAWGFGSMGQLGNGTNNGTNSIPVQVSNISAVVNIEGGFGHSLAVKSDGTVWAWGYNINGQLGNGNNLDSNTPLQVQNLSGIIKVAAGFVHSSALKSDGSVWSWGSNTYGQLGDNSNIDRNSPVQVLGINNVVSIAAGDLHTLSLKSDASMMAWGYNFPGQLGDGTTIDRDTPVSVINLCQIAIPNALNDAEIDNFTIYPNPTYENLYVKGGNLNNGPIHVLLTNTLGQINYNETLKISNGSVETKISLGHLVSGIYFLIIDTGNTQKTFKINKL